MGVTSAVEQGGTNDVQSEARTQSTENGACDKARKSNSEKPETENEQHVEGKRSQQPGVSSESAPDDLTEKLENLSVKEVNIDSQKRSSSSPSDRSKPTAKSIIDAIEELKRRHNKESARAESEEEPKDEVHSKYIAHGKPLVSHGKFSAKATASTNPYPLKRPVALASSTRVPSEQDERDVCFDLEVEELLQGITGNNPLEYEHILRDLKALSDIDKSELDPYIASESAQMAQAPAPAQGQTAVQSPPQQHNFPSYNTNSASEKSMNQDLVPASPTHSVMSVDSNVRSPADTGYGTGSDEAFSPPQVPASPFSDFVESPASSDTIHDESSNSGTTSGLHSPPEYVLPPIDPLIARQMQMQGQTTMTQVRLVPQQPQSQGQQQQQQLWQQQQQQQYHFQSQQLPQVQQQLQQESPQMTMMTGIIQQSTPVTQIITVPNGVVTQLNSHSKQHQQQPMQQQPMQPTLAVRAPNTSQMSYNQTPGGATNSCGCGRPNCGHARIVPKPSPQQLRGPAPMPLFRPPATPLDEIINKLPRKEVICARRWVAGIKTELIMQPDQDGDLSLHIVVCQADRPKLIALLERCKREHIVQDLINKQNFQTHTLIFLAIVTLPDTQQPDIDMIVTSAADMIAILLQHGADPLVRTIITRNNYTDKEYRFPVHVAATKGNNAVRVMSELLAHRRDEQLRIGCESGKTALHYAAYCHRERPSDQMVLHLFQQGADINAKEGKGGKTPLHYLIESNDVLLVQRILQLLGSERAKMAVNAQAYDGCTSLHIAAQLSGDVQTHLAMVKVLVSHGADIATKNSQGQRPSNLVHEDRQQVASILKCGNTNKHVGRPQYFH